MGTGSGYKNRLVRPSLTIVFIAAIPFWMACALLFSAGRTFTGAECRTIAVALLVATSISAIVAFSIRQKTIAIVTGAVLLGGCLGCAQAANLHMGAESIDRELYENAILEFEEDTRLSGYGESGLVRVSIEGKPTLKLTYQGSDIHLFGDRISATVRIKPAEYGNPKDRNWESGSVGRVSIVSPAEKLPTVFPGILLSLRAEALERIGHDDDAHAVLQALVCGHRRELASSGGSSDLYGDYQTCGLAHMVAVSGAHLVIVTALFAQILKRLGIPRKASIIILIAIMASYLLVSGAPVSALRATVMSSIGILSLFGKRRPSTQNALGLGIFAIVGTSPVTAVSASFALSALSTIGIILFCPLVEAWLENTVLTRFPAVCDALALTTSSGFLSQLYGCALFGMLPLISPVSNIVCAPLFPITCGLGLLAGVMSSIGVPGAEIAIFIAALSARIMNGVVEVLAQIPYSCIPIDIELYSALILTVIISASLWIAWPDAKRAGIAGAFVFAIGLGTVIVLPGGDTITMLDVGQGDALLIRSQGQSLLIDTGNQDTRLAKELARNRIAHLDSVLITHADDDHYGSLDVLQKTVVVDRVLLAQDMLSCPSEKPRKLIGESLALTSEIKGLEVGDAFAVGAFTVTILWPHDFNEEGGNADSLCALVSYDSDSDGRSDSNALFTGDAESAQMTQILEDNRLEGIDILKVGHHGSKNGMTEEQVRQLKPRIALISVGQGNRYGHPAESILEMLESNGCTIYRSDTDGEVECRFSIEGISVRCLG